MNGIESEVGEKIDSSLELLLGLPGEAYDDIGSKSDGGDGKAYLFD